jgi:hypothetical protein
MVCTFFHPVVRKCVNAYCYYETSQTIDCPVKKEVMAAIGPVDPALKKILIKPQVITNRKI